MAPAYQHRRCHPTGALPSVAKSYGIGKVRNRFLHLFVHDDAGRVCDDVLQVNVLGVFLVGAWKAFLRSGAERGAGPGCTRKRVGGGMLFGGQDGGQATR
jgi:hypothetical protein